MDAQSGGGEVRSAYAARVQGLGQSAGQPRDGVECVGDGCLCHRYSDRQPHDVGNSCSSGGSGDRDSGRLRGEGGGRHVYFLSDSSGGYDTPQHQVQLLVGSCRKSFEQCKFQLGCLRGQFCVSLRCQDGHGDRGIGANVVEEGVSRNIVISPNVIPAESVVIRCSTRVRP
ncbi:hypothetical protein GCM10020255_077380 [Rhodococcus baikonurensis]